jgi:D-3-phosphoglycerate dehydrogenase
MGQRALLLEPDFYGPESLERLRGSHVEWQAEFCEGREDLIRNLETARRGKSPYTAVFCRLGLGLDAEVFEAGADALQWIVTPTTGLAHIDESEAQKRGIRVLSLKGHTDFLKTISSTAELTIGLLLALVRRIPAAHEDVVRNGGWRRAPFLGRELRGMTLGLIGLGRLGTLVAGYAQALGMKVLACDTRDEAFLDQANLHVERRDPDSLLAEADVVSLHLPLEKSTRNFLHEGRIRAMKRGAFLINTARGELLDEAALLASLRAGSLGGAALDVLAEDSRWEGSVPDSHPLVSHARSHDNLLLTPHIGGYSLDAIMKTRSFMVERFCQELASAGEMK